MKSLVALTLLGLPFAASAQVPSDTINPAISSSTGVATGTVQSSANRVTPTVPDGYVTLGDKTYVLKDGRVFQLTESITLQIRPDGRVIGFEGEEMSIPTGLMLTTDGRLVKAPQLGAEPDGSTYQLDRGMAGDSSMGTGMSESDPNSSGLDSEDDSEGTGTVNEDFDNDTNLIGGGSGTLNPDEIDDQLNRATNNRNGIDPVSDSNNQLGNSSNSDRNAGSTGRGSDGQPTGNENPTSNSNANPNNQNSQGINESNSTSGNTGRGTMNEPAGNENPDSNTNASNTGENDSSNSNGSNESSSSSGNSNGSSSSTGSSNGGSSSSSGSGGSSGGGSAAGGGAR